MKKKTNLAKIERREERLQEKVLSSDTVIYLTFTELRRIKQDDLVKMLQDGTKVFIQGINCPPLKISIATVS